MSFLQRTDFMQSCITLSLKNRESTGIVRYCECLWGGLNMCGAEWLHKILKKIRSRQNSTKCVIINT